MKNFNYQKICADLLNNLPQRTADVIERRFGLKGGQRDTLEAIGETYELTRERVRQIEQVGLAEIQPKLKNYQKIFQSFQDTLSVFGGLKEEKSLLENLGENKFQNHIFFLLTIGQGFKRFVEDDNFYSFWANDKESINLAKKVLKLIVNKLEQKQRTFTLDELFKTQKREISKISNKINKDVLFSYLGISRKIQKNPEERWGLEDWIEINPRGIKDKAYLVFKKENRPLHFSQVASLIENLPFAPKTKVQIATVHNELIRDQRFVLVGRGLYALKEWGYEPGLVRDIIRKTLGESKRPLTKQEILEKVLQQRFVKANTISLNLNDKTYFFRNSDGKYQVKEI